MADYFLTPKHSWGNAPIPVYATLLLIIVSSALSWYAGSNHPSSARYVETIKLKTDTVFIASKPDTVVRERIIYVNHQPSLPTLQVTNIKPQLLPASKGINMKEKEELELLLVSGSM